jgi:hypothetical protein
MPLAVGAFQSISKMRFSCGLSGQHSMMIRRATFVSGQVFTARLLLLAGTLLLSACSSAFDDHPPVYPVKGKVIFKGKPMKGGTILFEYAGEGSDTLKGPPGQPFRVTGKINNEGTFNLVAYPGSEGMPAGNYKVGISIVQGRSESNILNRTLVVEKKGHSAVSTNRYADPKTSDLTAEVSKDRPNEPVFELK